MKPFKKIVIKPLKDLESLKLNVNENKVMDLSHIPPDELKEKMQQVYELLKKFNEGILFIGNEEDGLFVGSVISSSKNKKKTIVLQEPNPIHIYYKTANECLEKSYKIRGKIISQNKYSSIEYYSLMVDFFQNISQGLIFLITTIEGFFNQILPDNFLLHFRKTDTRGDIIEDKIFYKSDIEWMPFDQKINTVVPLMCQIEISDTYQKIANTLLKINNLRNDLVHLKAVIKKNFTSYEDLNKKLLDFDSHEASEVVFKFINMVRPGYLVEKQA